LRVKQHDPVLIDEKQVLPVKDNKPAMDAVTINVPSSQTSAVGSVLPTAKFSNYKFQGKTYLLSKTEEGFSLYEESATAADGLLSKGKIIIMNAVVKYIDTSGVTTDATFDASGNLILGDGSNKAIYTLEN